MLGGSSSGATGIQNDKTQPVSQEFNDSNQTTNDMDDEIPF